MRSSAVLFASVVLASAPVGAEPVTLDFDTPPPSPWIHGDSGGSGSTISASGGILTIETPGFNEFHLRPPDGEWHQYVDNARGWTIEARLRVDPATDPECGDRGSLHIWAHDHTVIVIVGFSTNEICLAYPENVRYPMNTTDDFHTYRITVQGTHVTIAADGIDRIHRDLTWLGGGTVTLTFGDGTGGSYSKSYWDYLSYDTGAELDDSDSDGTADVFDNCPALANPDQADADLDGIGDLCDPFPDEGDHEKAQCFVDLDQTLIELEECRANPSFPDEDGDGEADPTDACPATPAEVAVDAGGCSHDQFCSAIPVRTGVGHARCNLADFRNDEALGAFDCHVKRGECVRGPERRGHVRR